MPFFCLKLHTSCNTKPRTAGRHVLRESSWGCSYPRCASHTARKGPHYAFSEYSGTSQHPALAPKSPRVHFKGFPDWNPMSLHDRQVWSDLYNEPLEAELMHWMHEEDQTTSHCEDGTQLTCLGNFRMLSFNNCFRDETRWSLVELQGKFFFRCTYSDVLHTCLEMASLDITEAHGQAPGP